MPQVRSMRFPADIAMLAAVRDFAVAAASELHSTVDLADLAVVAGELAANAAIHQDHVAMLAIVPLDDGGVRVEVTDHAPSGPQLGRHSSTEAPGHRGLDVVQALSKAWGVEPTPTGKMVWAQLPPATTSVGEAKHRTV